MKNLDLTNINFMTGIGTNHFTHCGQADADCFSHDLFVSGDYCGSLVHASNRKVMLENTDLCERLGIIELNEGYSTDSILFPIAALQDQEIIDIFLSLEYYPCLNDESMSELESDLEVECFESYGLRDFKEHLRVKTDFDIESLDDSQIEEIYWNCSRATNYDVFTSESGTCGFFDFKSFGGLYEKQLSLFDAELTKLNCKKVEEL